MVCHPADDSSGGGDCTRTLSLKTPRLFREFHKNQRLLYDQRTNHRLPQRKDLEKENSLGKGQW